MQPINNDKILSDYCIKHKSDAKNIINYMMARTNLKKYDTANDNDRTEDLLQGFFLHVWENSSLKNKNISKAYLDQSLRNFVISELRKEISDNAKKTSLRQFNSCDSHTKNSGSSSDTESQHDYNSLTRNQYEERNQISCIEIKRATFKFIKSLKNTRDRRLAYSFFEENLSIKDVSIKYKLAMTYAFALRKKLRVKAQQFLLNEGITPSNLSN